MKKFLLIADLFVLLFAGVSVARCLEVYQMNEIAWVMSLYLMFSLVICGIGAFIHAKLNDEQSHFCTYCLQYVFGINSLVAVWAMFYTA